uniref:Rna-binding region rnp-1 domain-containing protein n=1 Tax=Tetraselmis sp. GSL018 TaxID=582737 RepID=A0A061QQP4_9CHLO
METGAEAGVWPQGMGSYGWGLDAMGGLNGSGVTSLYVKNLPPEADKLYLYEKFAIYGGIASVKVLLDEATGACKGVGFINYVDPNAAMEAIHAMNGLKVGDKQLHVSLQTHRPGSRGGHTGGYFPAALH